MLKTYVHDDAAFEENLVNIYMQESLHNMHIYTTIYVQMAPNNTTGHSNQQLLTVTLRLHTYMLQFWTPLGYMHTYKQFVTSERSWNHLQQAKYCLEL